MFLHGASTCASAPLRSACRERPRTVLLRLCATLGGASWKMLTSLRLLLCYSAAPPLVTIYPP